MRGSLFLVGTPIGNLGDITLRAVECLRTVDRIYAEDTRRSRVLLTHLGIEGTRLFSLHAHSSERAIANAIEILLSGEDAALVTDAGMPAVSDPGAELVRAAREAEIRVTVLPGPSAVTAAVALSGLVDGPFCFLGFLPRKGKKRARALAKIAESDMPTVLFESPHRVAETFVELEQACGGDRKVAICREVTKKFEETLVISLGECSKTDFRENWQGEFTLVIERSDGQGESADDSYDLGERASQLLGEGMSVKDVSQALSRELEQRGEKRPRRELYAEVLALSRNLPQELENTAESPTE
jgi:16S rRNA (cytidine1402-2'-O)-methyltransferase